MLRLSGYFLKRLYHTHQTQPLLCNWSLEQSAEGNSIDIPSGTKYFALASYNTCDIKTINVSYRCGDDGYNEDNSNFTLNIVGTNDIHGQTLKNDEGNAGLTNASKKINDLKIEFENNENGVTAPKCLTYADTGHLYAEGITSEVNDISQM